MLIINERIMNMKMVDARFLLRSKKYLQKSHLFKKTRRGRKTNKNKTVLLIREIVLLDKQHIGMLCCSYRYFCCYL